jgi:hypothetical protein
MQPFSELDADAGQFLSERRRTVDRPAGSLEGGQDPVAGGLDEMAAELLDQPAGQLVVHVQQLSPAPVAELPGSAGGTDDVGEQHRRQHPGWVGYGADAGQEPLDVV